MENEKQNQPTEELSEAVEIKKDYLLPGSILISAVILAGAWVYTTGLKSAASDQKTNIAEVSGRVQVSALEEEVLPSEGVSLPVVWGDLGARLVSVGAIDADRFKTIYDERGAFTSEYRDLLLGQNNDKLKITKANAGFLLNLFWALGLASKNPVLDSGEMKNPAYGGAQNFASTGGWTIAKGSAMDHYSRHMFFQLTPEQQALVDKVSRGAYRPCCGNSTHFPDCNHGMAMLGLLELLASQGVGEEDMRKAALAVNSYWFPDTYLTIAAYMKNKGVDWKEVNAQEILGVNFSSASGYRKIASQVALPVGERGGNGCGVDAGDKVAGVRAKSGCNI